MASVIRFAKITGKSEMQQRPIAIKHVNRYILLMKLAPTRSLSIDSGENGLNSSLPVGAGR